MEDIIKRFFEAFLHFRKKGDLLRAAFFPKVQYGSKNAKIDKVTFFRGKKYPHNLGISLSGEDGKFEVHIVTTEKFAEKQSYPTDSFRWPNVCLRTQENA